jgi:3-oxoacyl-[acyl-carrier protein] reductase
MSFQNQVVIVTGATRGIGEAIAKAFAQAGATTIIIGRNTELAAKVTADIKKKGQKAEYYIADVTKPSEVQEIANKILDKHKSVDILVNNAGVTKDNLLLRMSENDWDEVMNINLKGVFNCTKVFAKAMLKAQKGRIINVSSIIGIKGNAGQSNYAASKAGIIGFTKSVARELASRNITANAIAPGYIQTDMTSQLKETTREELLKSIPLGRLGTTEDISGVCLFLASPQASYITGQTIIIDGGLAI